MNTEMDESMRDLLSSFAKPAFHGLGVTRQASYHNCKMWFPTLWFLKKGSQMPVAENGPWDSFSMVNSLAA